MKLLKIRTPIWKTKSIGIAEKKLKDELKIKIEYKDKYGNKTFPDTYTMDSEKIKTYPIQWRKGVKLFIVPIEDLDII